jgi:hypothetical protein
LRKSLSSAQDAAACYYATPQTSLVKPVPKMDTPRAVNVVKKKPDKAINNVEEIDR